MTNSTSNSPSAPVDPLFDAADKWVDAKRDLKGDGQNADKKAKKRDADQQLEKVVIQERRVRGRL